MNISKTKFMENDIVHCIGEGPDALFIVREISGLCAWLDSVESDYCLGWESFSKLTKVDKKELVRLKDKYSSRLSKVEGIINGQNTR